MSCRPLGTRSVYFLFLLGVLALSAYAVPAKALTMIDQDLTEVQSSAAKDRNQDGKADGDIILARLFRSQKVHGLRKDYTFKVEKYLSEEPTNLKQILKPGDLFTLPSPVQNPFTYILKDTSGSLYVMFLRQSPKGHWIPLSMKFAPVSEETDSTGEKHLMLTNPWIRASESQSNLAQSTNIPEYGEVLHEPLDTFLKRLQK